MPPRKKAKAAPSTPIADEDSMVIDSPTPKAHAKEPEYDILKDPWTDEQETSLFKGLMKWKPNGMHKHFRMLALSEYLRNHGYDPQTETHTRIPGIWQKLQTLYNMPIIDDRENSFEYEEEFQDKYHEFELPPDDYATDTFMRGKLDNLSEAGSSPSGLGRSPTPQATLPTRKRKRGETITQTRTRASTVEDTDETRTSPVASPPAKTTRSGRSSNRRAAAETSSRQPSRETTIDEEQDEDEAEDEEEEVEEDAEEEDQETEEEGSKSPKPAKSKTKSKADAPVTRKSRRKR